MYAGTVSGSGATLVGGYAAPAVETRAPAYGAPRAYGAPVVETRAYGAPAVETLARETFVAGSRVSSGPSVGSRFVEAPGSLRAVSQQLTQVQSPERIYQVPQMQFQEIVRTAPAAVPQEIKTAAPSPLVQTLAPQIQAGKKIAEVSQPQVVLKKEPAPEVSVPAQTKENATINKTCTSAAEDNLDSVKEELASLHELVTQEQVRRKSFPGQGNEQVSDEEIADLCRRTEDLQTKLLSAQDSAEEKPTRSQGNREITWCGCFGGMLFGRP
jgi:hypothetical protein